MRCEMLPAGRGGVEPRAGSITRDEDVRGAAEECDAILHLVGIASESGSECTFESVNIEGTRRIVEEAARVGVSRLVYLSSLGAEQGSTEYQRSKFAAEHIVGRWEGNWLICRPGNVYGPGDKMISVLLKLVRTLPAIPTIRAGDEPFQPIWVGDLAETCARAIEREEPAREVLELAGPEQITPNQLVRLIAEVIQKKIVTFPVPDWTALAGSEALARFGIDLHFGRDQITMLREGNVIPPDGCNALTEVFGVEPTPVRDGLTKLIAALPEQLPSDGSGSLHRERYWADIRGSRMGAEELFRLVCHEFSSFPPPVLLQVGVEGEDEPCLEEGSILTLSIPLRGNVQVRVEEIRDQTATAVTVEGHPLAGTIRFLVERMNGESAPEGAGGAEVRFEVRSYTRASNLLDRIALGTIGEPLRRATWESFVEEVVRRSGGEAVGGSAEREGDAGGG